MITLNLHVIAILLFQQIPLSLKLGCLSLQWFVKTCTVHFVVTVLHRYMYVSNREDLTRHSDLCKNYALYVIYMNGLT